MDGTPPQIKRGCKIDLDRASGCMQRVSASIMLGKFRKKINHPHSWGEISCLKQKIMIFPVLSGKLSHCFARSRLFSGCVRCSNRYSIAEGASDVAMAGLARQSLPEISVHWDVFCERYGIIPRKTALRWLPSGKQPQFTNWKDPPCYSWENSTISTGPWLLCRKL